MNTINYAVEYEYAAMGLIAVLILIFCARRKYPGMSNRVYAGLLICTFMSAATHVFAMKSLPIAGDLPVWLNYVIHISYLFFYDLEAVLFIMYIIALTKRNKMSKASTISTVVLICAETVLLVTTPFTKLIIYFDESMNYCHGPAFYVYPVIAFTLMIYGTVMFVNDRWKTNRIQAVTMMLFAVLTISATIFQLFVPSQVVGNFIDALVMVMFLIIIQNPDDFTDKTADCYNYDAFFNSVESRLDQGKPFAIAAFRFDGLNYINGLFRVGERSAAPKAIALRLMTGLQTSGVYHLGSCEFAMFTDEKHRVTEQYLTERIMRMFLKPVEINGIKASLTPKICVVRYPDFASSAEDVRDAIEYTLRTSKKAEGSVFVASQESIKAKKRELRILSAIKTNIVDQSFEMYYQPIYEPAERGFVSAEALIRMKDEELGFVSPEEFIPLAESNGMIIEIGDIAFRKVCEFMKSGEAQRLGVKYVEVNLSVLQCVQEQFSDHLMQMMEEYGIPPEQINFEITETAGLANYEALLKNMNSLIAHGVTFSMDDYGTGFSTANYLISLPMDIVKIDKSILWPAMENEEAFVILRHTVEMLKSLNKRIVVEGVETKDMAQLLIDMGCDYLQGYYYQKPVPADKYLEFLKENQNFSEKIQKTT
ncbi:MAG: EAL domain-containing protein [Oscillospiraceae bacterium]|nr:EAL domain-containing protein [Oscillospiraceae bacterium]